MGKLEISCRHQYRNNLFESDGCYEHRRQGKWSGNQLNFKLRIHVLIMPIYVIRIQWYWWGVEARSGFAKFTDDHRFTDATNQTILSIVTWCPAKCFMEPNTYSWAIRQDIYHTCTYAGCEPRPQFPEQKIVTFKPKRVNWIYYFIQE